MKEWTYSVIPQTTEKYISLMAQFQVGWNKKQKRAIYFQLKFLDSYQFLSASLAGLAKTLPKEDYHMVRKHLLQGDKAQYEKLVFDKGIFPYSWFDREDKMEERQLPPREQFVDTLRFNDPLCLPSADDYIRAQAMWRAYDCQTFGDYLSLYLQLDVLILADLFEEFRAQVFEDYGLDPVHYFTLPNLTWDAAFKMTRAEVDLLTDAEMYEFFERGIRGGVSFGNKHFVRVNQPSIPETYDPSLPLRDILYFDANNLYGHALFQKLPQRDF